MGGSWAMGNSLRKPPPVYAPLGVDQRLTPVLYRLRRIPGHTFNRSLQQRWRGKAQLDRLVMVEGNGWYDGHVDVVKSNSQTVAVLVEFQSSQVQVKKHTNSITCVQQKDNQNKKEYYGLLKCR